MHEGHRSRLTNRVLDGTNLHEHELLEILLYNACPRKDLNACAHRLISKFKNIKGVLSATVEELMEVEGVGINMAEYLSCLGLCLKQCGNSTNFGILKTTEEFEKLLSSKRFNCNGELTLHVVDIDGRIKRIVALPPERIAREEIITFLSATNAYGVFAGDMRKGRAEPTAYDERIAEAVATACHSCGVRLYDFIIVGDDNSTYSYFVNDKLSGDRI